MQDLDLALYSGVDIPLPELQLVLHNPTIEEISMIGEKWFFKSLQIVLIDKKQVGLEKEVNISNFTILQQLLAQEETKKEIRQMITDIFSLIVPGSTITFTPRAFLLKVNETNTILDEGNFEEFQAILRQIFCIKSDEEDYNPANKQAEQIANKIKKAHARIAEIKGDNVGSMYARLISILAVGLHISPRELIKCTIYQLNDLNERFGLWQNWDLEIRSRLAGAKGDGNPEDWRRNIHT